MTTYSWIKILHLLSAALYAGVSFASGLHKTLADRRGDPVAAASALAGVRACNRLFLLPATVVLPITGYAMVWLQGLELLSSWLVTPLVLFGLLTLILLWSIRLESRLLELAERACRDGGPLCAEYARRSRTWNVLGGMATAMVLAMFALMGLKRSLF